MNNYQIITDEQKLIELEENECFYLCLFARNKYVRDNPLLAQGITADKAQIKRFTAKKANLLNKIKQLETTVGNYETRLGYKIPQESLALYITVNPRSNYKAMLNCMKKFCDILDTQGKGFNIHQEALSAIQQSCSRKVYSDIDFDIDKSGMIETVKTIKKYINEDCLTIVETRGGFHCMIELKKIAKEFEKSWYKNITSINGADVVSDNMLPIPGTYQGGFTPRFV